MFVVKGLFSLMELLPMSSAHSMGVHASSPSSKCMR